MERICQKKISRISNAMNSRTLYIICIIQNLVKIIQLPFHSSTERSKSSKVWSYGWEAGSSVGSAYYCKSCKIRYFSRIFFTTFISRFTWKKNIWRIKKILIVCKIELPLYTKLIDIYIYIYLLLIQENWAEPISKDSSNENDIIRINWQSSKKL